MRTYFQKSLYTHVFHLNQSIYRQTQSEGLQEAYNNAGDGLLKTQTRMLMALAFVSVNDVKRCFEILRDELVDELSLIHI